MVGCAIALRAVFDFLKARQENKAYVLMKLVLIAQKNKLYGKMGSGLFYGILKGLKYSILHNINYSTRDNLESLVDFLDWWRDLCGWKIA